MKHNSGTRFSDRVEDYINYRPHYPDEVFQFIEAEAGLHGPSVIADIGSGTGISTEPFLKRGHTVYAVEPNADMREAAERLLAGYPEFESVDGSAEMTQLQARSIDLIVAGQAFHWFDQVGAKQEFQRVLKQGGYVALVWNDRRTNSTDFLKVYEDFLNMFGSDYKEVNHRNVQSPEVFNAFFGTGNYKEQHFYNYQDVDFTGLKGRVLSSSYMPREGHPDYAFMLSCLKKIFLRYQESGTVRLDYDTRVYIGTLI